MIFRFKLIRFALKMLDLYNQNFPYFYFNL